VLAGELDNLTPPYLSERLAALIPAATLRVMDCAHSGIVETPDQYARDSGFPGVALLVGTREG